MRRKFRLSVVLGVLLVLQGASCSRVSGPEPGVRLTPCRIDGFPEEIKCTSVWSLSPGAAPLTGEFPFTLRSCRLWPAWPRAIRSCCWPAGPDRPRRHSGRGSRPSSLRFDGIATFFSSINAALDCRKRSGAVPASRAPARRSWSVKRQRAGSAWRRSTATLDTTRMVRRWRTSTRSGPRSATRS